MKKNLESDFMSRDFGDEIRKALADGSAITGEGDSVVSFIAKVKAAKEAANAKKMYSMRLKISTVERLKEKAKSAGVPYQTYVNALLDQHAIA